MHKIAISYACVQTYKTQPKFCKKIEDEYEAVLCYAPNDPQESAIKYKFPLVTIELSPTGQQDVLSTPGEALWAGQGAKGRGLGARARGRGGAVA